MVLTFLAFLQIKYKFDLQIFIIYKIEIFSFKKKILILYKTLTMLQALYRGMPLR